MPLKLKDISSYLSFAKKLSNTSEKILKKTPSNRIKINFKSEIILPFKSKYIVKIYLIGFYLFFKFSFIYKIAFTRKL